MSNKALIKVDAEYVYLTGMELLETSSKDIASLLLEDIASKSKSALPLK
jgi:hypothetical protein